MMNFKNKFPFFRPEPPLAVSVERSPRHFDWITKEYSLLR